MLKKYLPAVALAGIMLAASAPRASAQVEARVFVNVRPPVEVVETAPARPSPGHYWIAGHHQWVGGHYEWVRGYWALPPRGRREWVPGHWDREPRGYFWVEGRWR